MLYTKEWTNKVIVGLIVGVSLLAISALLLSISITWLVNNAKEVMEGAVTPMQGLIKLAPFIIMIIIGTPLGFIGLTKTVNNTARLIGQAKYNSVTKNMEIQEKYVRDYVEKTTNKDALQYCYQSNITVMPNPGQVDNTVKNTGGSTVFNVFWIIFVGIWSVISNFCLGVALCCTIIGIPAGISCFKFIPLVFRPAGREVRLHYGNHKFWNTVNFLFGGLASYLIYTIYGILLCITIIGIPLGRQFFKIANFHLAPFGSETVIASAFSKNRNHFKDVKIFYAHLLNENRPVLLSNGATVTAIDALRILFSNRTDNRSFTSYCSNAPKTKVEIIARGFLYGLFIFLLGFIEVMIFVLTGALDLSDLANSGNQLALFLPFGVCGLMTLASVFGSIFGANVIHPYKVAEMKTFQEQLLPIASYYPRQAKPLSKKEEARIYCLLKVASETMSPGY